jgi:hypothetical protein
MMRAFEFISSSFDSFTFGIWSSLRNRLTVSRTPAPENGRLHFPAIDSKIVSTTPEIFSVLKAQRLQLLYRGSRDGFRSRDLHARCDGHPNTVSLILSTNNCVFGGVASSVWRHEVGSPVMDFLFTIKNPHNLGPRIFMPKQQYRTEDDFLSEDSSDDGAMSGHTFVHSSDHACDFGDLYVCDECQKFARSWSRLGDWYANHTGIAGDQVLTGDRYFTVDEIEVFEVIAQP